MSRGRRRALSLLGSALAVPLAGCGSGRTDGDDVPDPYPDDLGSSLEVVSFDAPETALLDEPLGVRVRGLDPGDAIVVESSMVDGGGNRWRGRGRYVADEDGTVDLATDRSIDGTYAGVDGMGLVWSMRPADDGDDGPFGYGGETDLVLAVRRDGDLLGTTTIARRPARPDVELARLERDRYGVLAEPPSGSGPGVVVLHGSGGTPMVDVARRLASRGFVALAPRYFGTDGLPDTLAEVPVEAVGRAVDRLRDRADVAGDRIGLFGASKGGELALLAGAHLESVGPVVSYNGSGVVFESSTEPGSSSWSVDGDPVPHLGFSPGERDPFGFRNRLEPVYRAAYEDATDREREAATIPVERIRGPVLLVSGADDRLWPSRLLSSVAVDRLEREGRADVVDHGSYEDAGHLITPPYAPTYGRSEDDRHVYGGTPAGIARANADAWPRALETLGDGLDAKPELPG